MKLLRMTSVMAARLSLFMLLLLLSGCLKNEFTVSFELPASVNETYTLLYYASDPVKGWYMETVAMTHNGKAEVKGFTRNPTLVYVLDGSRTPAIAFYVERGDKILIKGDSPSPSSWNISGNKITEQWSRWRTDNRNILSQRDSERINDAVAKFVETNPDNPLSTLLLMNYFDRRLDKPRFEKLWKKLEDDALEEKWIELTASNDLIDYSPLSPGNIDILRLHTSGNGIDTLVFGNKPVFLYFYRNPTPTRSEDLDVLKELAKLYSDSASRVIADISFEPDSMRWESSLPADSLKGVVRAWVPRAEADSAMMRLGVERTPWVMVYDSKGRLKFRGSDARKAADAFRAAMPPEG